MKEIELFYLTYCPYCIHAKKAIAELLEENPSYADLQIKWIEESEEVELADSRDYYYVPTLFYEGEKLYEANPAHGYDTMKQNIHSALESVLRA